MRRNHSLKVASFAVLGWLLVGSIGCAESPTAIAPAGATFSKPADTPLLPVRLEFDKCLVDPAGVWEGQVTGDVVGDLRTELTALEITGPIWHVRFDWIISAGPRSFTADLAGTLNTTTGRVVMSGSVVDGFLAGARVHEEGQLVDALNSCFSGSIRIMPGSAS